MSKQHARLHSGRWRRTRRAVFERAGWRCENCGRPSRRLECDHKIPLARRRGQNPYDLKGLQALCRSCHIEKTRRERGRELTPEQQEWADWVRNF